MPCASFLLLLLLWWGSPTTGWAGDILRPHLPTVLPSAPTISLCLTDLREVAVDLQHDTTFTIDPDCPHAALQRFTLRLFSSLPHTLAWERKSFAESYGLPLPLKTPDAGHWPLLTLGFQCQGHPPICAVIATMESP
jgi:hypothetical protein